MAAPKRTTNRWEFQPVRSPAASAIPDRSAPTFIVLAMRSAKTNTTQIQRGIFRRRPLANPSPVTMPIRAHIICTAPISGHVTTEVHSKLVPSCAPAIE